MLDTRAPSVARRRSQTAASQRCLTIVSRKEPTPSVVFDTYWRFATERQAIFFRRFEAWRGPWTHDPVLREHKFTNAYRASDRVSQFLIKHVIYGEQYSLRDSVLRILLFKVFNKIETWRFLEESIGEIRESTFDIDRLDGLLSRALSSGASIYSAAYIMPSGPASIRQGRKHRMHLELLFNILKQGIPERLAAAERMSQAYEILVSIPSFGPFLAYQFVTDLNYSHHFDFSEMEFVVPGPGARDGIRKCFTSLGDYSESEVIRWVAERQGEEFQSRGLAFRSLWGRPLQLVDCQNLFCEVDKYARVVHPNFVGHTGRTRIKQRFSPKGSLDTPWFPPKWKINDLIENRG